MTQADLHTSLIAAITQGTRLSITLFDVAASIGNTERDLQLIGTEVSLLCSVLKQVQALLEHAHFNPSKIAVETAQKIILQCSKVFDEIASIMSPFATTPAVKDNEVFPAADVDFVSKVKWAFSRKSRISMLRATLESCKLTLSIMLNTMQLAEKLSQSSGSTKEEHEQDAAMTQSLLISQQYAVEQLEHWESEVEKEDEIARIFPEDTAIAQHAVRKRRKSRGRFVQMFSGLRIETDLPLQPLQQQQLVTHRERPSVWLESILAPPTQPGEHHPGRLKQKRLSSAATTNAPLQLLQRWTDQGGQFASRNEPQPHSQIPEVDPHLWRDSKFSFNSSGPSTAKSTTIDEISLQDPRPNLMRATSDFVSPKTGRVHSVGFHLVAGVDGSLEMSQSQSRDYADDNYDAIATAILQDHGAVLDTSQVSLCISYGGKTKILDKAEKPLDVLKHFDDLDLEPRLFLRRLHGRPP